MAKGRPALRFAVSRSNGGPALLDGARAFAVALGRALESEVDVVVSYDYSALLKAIVGGQADVAWMPPLMHARAVSEGAHLVVLSQRGGTLGYHSALLVADDRFQTLRDLVGVRAAWVDRASSSGYIFPRLHLLAAGLDPATTFASERFVGSAANAGRVLLSGEADLAACFLSVARDRKSAQHEVDRMFRTNGAPRVLEVTATIPPDGIVAARGLDQERRHRLQRTLLTLHTHADGRAALESLLQAECFARVRPEIVADLQRLVRHATP